MTARTSTTAELARALPAPRRRLGKASADRELRPAIPLLLPAVLIYGVFSLAPIALTIWLSFTNSRGLNTEAQFVGLDNYARAGVDPIVWQSLIHTSSGFLATW